MWSARKVLLLGLILILPLSGCYTKPVRHLAADVAMIQVGKTGEEDVVVFLGKPDKTRSLTDGHLQYLYEDNRRTLLEKTPGLGKYFGSPNIQRAVVTFKNGIVSDLQFFESDDDDMGWADDYSWQETEE